MKKDLVGLGWRPELALQILSNLDQIDVVEVLIDNYFDAPLSELRALKTLESQVPVVYHAVGLGLASAHKVDQKRLDKLARVLNFLAPDAWSEHLAFVRADGMEIGHLAAPPRTADTVEGALENLDRVKRTVGSYPALENVATLIDPPGSKMSESEWVTQIIRGSRGGLLLDLHNLYCNSINFGFEPVRYLDAFPLQSTHYVHLSGGMWLDEPTGPLIGNHSGRRLLDDHLHDVPDPVFGLLGHLAKAVSQPLTVIIERDGEYPDFKSLLAEVARARDALGKARVVSSRTEVHA